MKIYSHDIYNALYARLLSVMEDSCVATHEGFISLYEIFENMVAILLDGEMRVFGSSHSRVVYACRNNNIPAEIEYLSCVFQRRSRTFTSYIGHYDEYMTACATLCHILEKVSGVSIPTALGEKIKGLPFYDIKKTKHHAKTININAVINHISEVEYDDNGRFYILSLYPSNDEYGLPREIFLEVREDRMGRKRDDWFEVRTILNVCDSVNITDIYAVENTDATYRVSGESLIILEPDYLVDVTDLASCFTSYGYNEYLFLLSKLSQDKDSEALLKGTLVNDVLDARLKDGNCDMEDVFRVALSKNILKAIRYGGQSIKEIWDSVKEQHSENISLFADSLRGKRVAVEPSFISPLYGIQGRLDVMVEYANIPFRKDIYELKSGKAPSGEGLWKGNIMQVACYNMLLETAYGEDRRGTQAVLYSSARKTPLRNYLPDVQDKIDVTALRNKIVRIIYDMASGDFTSLDKIRVEHIGVYPVYARDRIEDFSRFYTRLKDVKKRYYHAFVAFYIREMICAKTGALGTIDRERGNAYSRLWRDTDNEKIRNFAILPSLSYHEYDALSHTIHMKITKTVEHSFRRGDVIILYPHDEDEKDVWKGQILKGTLCDIDETYIVFSPRGQVDEVYMKSHVNWAMEHDMMEKGYWAGIASLKEFVAGDTSVSRVVFGEEKPQVVDFPYENDDRLTLSQNTAVKKALCAKNFFLLQGPPGTGKTSGAIMSMVRNILAHTDDTLVLLAFTNRAVDEIGAKLRKDGIEYLRLGHQEACEEEITLSVLYQDKKINAARNALKKQRVILSTVAAFATRADDINAVIKLDEVIVDEASQLTEIQIVGVLSYFKKWILVGDQMQLPSVVVQSSTYTAVKDKKLLKIGLKDMSSSLFERLFCQCVEKGYDDHWAMLDTHFRMHEDIAAVVNRFYGGLLRSGTPRQCAESPSPRLIFCPSSYENSYKKHEGEARAVVRILEEIKNAKGDTFSYDTVGVVTPFRAQIAVIKNMIQDDEIRKKVLIDTVERFQGGEREIMVASMAVCSPVHMRMVRSMDIDETVDRKLNVMVSRAKEHFVILGYEPALSSETLYKELIDRCVRIEK